MVFFLAVVLVYENVFYASSSEENRNSQFLYPVTTKEASICTVKEGGATS